MCALPLVILPHQVLYNIYISGSTWYVHLTTGVILGRKGGAEGQGAPRHALLSVLLRAAIWQGALACPDLCRAQAAALARVIGL